MLKANSTLEICIFFVAAGYSHLNSKERDAHLLANKTRLKQAGETQRERKVIIQAAVLHVSLPHCSLYTIATHRPATLAELLKQLHTLKEIYGTQQ